MRLVQAMQHMVLLTPSNKWRTLGVPDATHGFACPFQHMAYFLLSQMQHMVLFAPSNKWRTLAVPDAHHKRAISSPNPRLEQRPVVSLITSLHIPPHIYISSVIRMYFPLLCMAISCLCFIIFRLTHAHTQYIYFLCSTCMYFSCTFYSKIEEKVWFARAFMSNGSWHG